jgi:hypothetical protein
MKLSPKTYMHETPFGMAGVTVRPDGSLYIQAAHSVDSRGYAVTGFHNGNGTAESPYIAVLNVNGKDYHQDFSVETNPRYGLPDLSKNAPTGVDLRTHVADFSAWCNYTPAARAKLAAHFEGQREIYATPVRIAAARLAEAMRDDERARKDAHEANVAFSAATVAARLADDELNAARVNLAMFGDDK